MPEIHSIDQQELMAYLDGELNVDRAVEVAAHLERCPECLQFAADLRSLTQLAAGWQVEVSRPELPAPVFVALGERGVLGFKDPPKATPIRDHWPRWVPWALVASALCVFPLSYSVFRQREQYHRAPVAGQMEPAAQYLQRDLSEGSKQLIESKPAWAPGDTQLPMLVRTAQIVITAPDFESARAALQAVILRHQGYVGSLTVNAPLNSGRELNATFRVPAAQLDGVLAELEKLGRVQSETQTANEVTSQYVDLEARLANARHTEQRLADLLRERTGKLADVLSVEQEMFRVRGEIERMEAQRKNLSNQVNYASITVLLNEDYRAQLIGSSGSPLSRFRNAAVDGYRGALDAAIRLIVLSLEYGPALILWGVVLFLPARFIYKAIRRRAPR